VIEEEKDEKREINLEEENQNKVNQNSISQGFFGNRNPSYTNM
jgi:predicted membrane protein